MTMHGHTRVDNYYWLKERENPEVVDYLKAENAYQEEMMKHTEPLQNQLFDEIIGRIRQDDMSVPVKHHGYWYYTRFEEGMEYPLYCRKLVKEGDNPTVIPSVVEESPSNEQILLDGYEMSKGYTLDLNQYANLNICGLMTMATNTDDEAEIHRCFRLLNSLADSDKRFAIRSMGMSDDYLLAIQDGSNMIRIGTDIFGARQY